VTLILHAPLGLQLHNLGTSGTHGVTSTSTSLGSHGDISVSLCLNVFPPTPKPPLPITVIEGHLHDPTPSSKDAARRVVRWLERFGTIQTCKASGAFGSGCNSRKSSVEPPQEGLSGGGAFHCRAQRGPLLTLTSPPPPMSLPPTP